MRLREDIVTNFKGIFVRLVRSGYMIDVFVDKKYKDITKNTTELLASIEYRPNRVKKKYIVKERKEDSPYKYAEYSYARDILRHPNFAIHFKRAINSKPGTNGKYTTSFAYMNYTLDIHGLQGIMDDIENMETINEIVDTNNDGPCKQYLVKGALL